MSADQPIISQLGSGIQGLDEILRGGYIDGRMYLISGGPGTGKTTLAMHFLAEGLANDETVLFIHGEESVAELQANMGQFAFDISGMEFLDLGPNSDFFTEDESYDLVDPSAIEQERYTETMHRKIREIDPDRVAIDPITQLRYIETSDHHFRKRILSFLRFLKERGVTIVGTATPDKTHDSDSAVISLSDGVILLSRTADGRRIEVIKNRGLGQLNGDHGFEIRATGVEVFPRISPEPTDREFDPSTLPTGNPELDDLVGGGFERGTVTFISGPPGVGKTTLGTLSLAESARNGRKSVIYLFEERMETFTHRLRSIGVPIDDLRETGRLKIQVIEPLALSAEEFADMVRREVEEEGAETVMIDGFRGYTTALQGAEDDLASDLHALTRYLVNQEVTVFVSDTIHQITGLTAPTSKQISPIADNIVFISYVDSRTSLKKVIGVLKKRAGDFDHSLREFEITGDGINVGEFIADIVPGDETAIQDSNEVRSDRDVPR